MAGFDDEHTWTTVVRRRSFKQRFSAIRHSQIPICPSRPSSNPSAQSLLPKGPHGLPAERNEGDQDDEDESLVLLRMRRSMLRVQESDFFRRFLDQTASSSVLDNLRRAAAPFPELGLYTRESAADAIAVCAKDSLGKSDRARESPGFESVDGMAFGILSTERFGHTSTHKVEVASRVEVKGESLNSNELLRKPYPREELGAGIGIEHWELQIVVYGLGKIADSEVSRCQFALVLLLKQKFPWIGSIEIYDPVLSQTECRVIKGLGCTTIAINEEGRRSIEKPTLFYMPHCEEWLYDNVLQANWTTPKLRQMVILGNSFGSYQERWSSFLGSRSKPPPTYVLEVQQTAHEIPLEGTSSLELPVFNNLSWHFFPGCASKFTMDSCLMVILES